jgi:hypothetical protein
MSTEQQQGTNSNSNNEGTDKLYAGKFKTVEELEVGYNNSAKVFQENSDLKKKLDEVSRVPDDYNPPQGIALHETDLAEAKRLAKESGMTQSQFERFAKEQESKSRKMVDDFEAAKKDIGADKLNLLQDYIKNYYPEKIQDHMLKTLIKNKEAREAAFAHREQLLNSSAPGMGTPSRPFEYRVQYDDVLKAREAHQKNKSDPKLRKRYLDITSAYAHQKDNG